MLNIRRYRESDSKQVGVLIADTYNKFNLSELTTKQREEMLGPFFARPFIRTRPSKGHCRRASGANCASC